MRNGDKRRISILERKCYIFRIVLHGLEGWTLTEARAKRNSFETYMWMLQIY